VFLSRHRAQSLHINELAYRNEQLVPPLGDGIRGVLSMDIAGVAMAQVTIAAPALTPEQREAQKAAAAERRAQFERGLAGRFVVSSNEVYDRKTDRT
jgi:hypothetical protein